MKAFPGLPGPGAPTVGAPMALADFMAGAGADLGVSGWVCVEVIRPVEGIKAKVNYGFDRVRFLAPVPSGARIRARVRRESVEEKKPGRLSILHVVTVEIEGAERPALSAEWLSMWTLEGAP